MLPRCRALSSRSLAARIYYRTLVMPIVVGSTSQKGHVLCKILETGCGREGWGVDVNFSCRLPGEKIKGGKDVTMCPRSSDPFLYSNLLHKLGHYFMDIQYV